MKIKSNSLNIGRKRDPQGYFVAIMSREVYEKLRDFVDQLMVTSQVVIEQAGTFYMIKTRSWSIMERIANVARQRGINVEERRL